MANRTKKIALRVTAKEKEFLEKISGETGTGTSELVRNWMMLNYMQKLNLSPDEIVEMKAEIERRVKKAMRKRKAE